MAYSILFLDDEKDLGEPLAEILKNEGYEVDYFQSGNEAVEAGKKKQYDLLLLDIMLNNFNVPSYNEITNGMEVARLINQTQPTPFIFISGRSDTFDMVAGLEMGAANYIPKPYDLSLLLATLRAFFREKERMSTLQQSVPEMEITVGDIRIDLTSRRVFVKDKEVLVQEKPLAILIYLMKHQERPVTKEELLQEVWGYSSSDGIQTNNVEVNIARLRNAIGEHYIRTARGEGYYLQVKDG